MKTIIKNPNKEIVQAIENRLKITEDQCPCVPETEWNEDTICPCKKFRETKECCCGLYVAMEHYGLREV